MPEFRGAVLDDSGAAISGATVELYDADTTTPVRATTTTDSSGLWAVSHSTRGRFDVKVTNGSDIVWLRVRDRFQVSHMNINENAANLEALIVTRSEDAASVEVATFEGDRATPAAADAAHISLKLSDSAGNQDEMARLEWIAIDETTTTEDGALAIHTLTAGSLSEKVRIDENGTVFIGDTANANMTVGMTINQGANDDQAIDLKSSDIGTGLTTATLLIDVEADDYFAVGKRNPTLGGVALIGLAEDAAVNEVIHTQAIGGTAGTGKTTAGTGLIHYYAAEHDGANALANITADGNVFSVAARVGAADVTRFMIDEDGDLFAVNTTVTALDTEDDVALIRAFELTRAEDGIIRDKWDEFVNYNEADLVRVGVLGAPMAEGGMWNVTQHMRLLNGAIWQQAKKIMALEQRLAALPE